MPKYVIERDIPGAGSVSDDEIYSISQKNNAVLADLGDVQWLHSYVTDDKLVCVYIAPSEDRVREHATRAGFRPTPSAKSCASSTHPLAVPDAQPGDSSSRFGPPRRRLIDRPSAGVADAPRLAHL